MFRTRWRFAAPALAVVCTLSWASAAQAAPIRVALTQPPDRMITVWVVVSLLSLASAAIATVTLVWMLHAWRTPSGLERTRFRGAPASSRMSFSLLVPGRHEEAVLGSTLSRLAALEHPDYEVLAIVGHDDPGTHAVAEAVARRHPGRVRVIVDHSWPKSKPKALNAALPFCRGDVVGVFDAEDDVHPGLLAKVEQQFGESGAHVVQGGVQLMNHNSSWYSLRNVLEYFFWFASRLHFHAEQQFIPLGGNTVFVRTPLLRAVDGWDPECLAEDCELGVRLSALGARTVVAYEPEFVTREETPDTLGALIKQRTRWSQGFLQVLRKGEWRRLRRRQRLLGLYTLSTPFLQAFSGLLIPLAFATGFALHAPVPVVLISFVPLVPTLIILAAEVAALGHFCRQYGRRSRPMDYARLVLGFFPYQAVLAYAAVRATVRELLGVRNWEKTAHIGAHLEGARA
jgi:cellulose synthase/poly-beta-1,6-N-acetylglucosamine synthase-like glycosyltransferase